MSEENTLFEIRARRLLGFWHCGECGIRAMWGRGTPLYLDGYAVRDEPCLECGGQMVAVDEQGKRHRANPPRVLS